LLAISLQRSTAPAALNVKTCRVAGSTRVGARFPGRCGYPQLCSPKRRELSERFPELSGVHSFEGGRIDRDVWPFPGAPGLSCSAASIRGILRLKRLSQRQLRRYGMVLFCYPKTASQSDSVKRYLGSFEGAMRINNESEPNTVAFSRSARPPPRFGPHDNSGGHDAQT
jgi:hypothetical protein